MIVIFKGERISAEENRAFSLYTLSTAINYRLMLNLTLPFFRNCFNLLSTLMLPSYSQPTTIEFSSLHQGSKLKMSEVDVNLFALSIKILSSFLTILS